MRSKRCCLDRHCEATIHALPPVGRAADGRLVFRCRRLNERRSGAWCCGAVRSVRRTVGPAKQSQHWDCFAAPSGLLAMTLFVLVFVFPSWLLAQTSVSGRVVFEGTPPPSEHVEVKSDVATCGNTKEVKKLVLGENNGVVNAVVTIIGAQAGDGSLKPKEGLLNQVKCEFVPHVQVLPVGSKLNITSSDPVLHNSHGFYEDGSTAFNIAVPISGMELPTTLKQPGVIKLRCDAGHTWMSAYVIVTDQPYYTVTDASGNFTIEGVPAGTYDIEVWHEWLGRHRESIEVKEEKRPITISLKKQ